MSVYVKNTTEADIKQMFDGMDYVFPKDGGLEFEDTAVANWFVSKLYRPASPADNKPRPVYPLIIAEKPAEKKAQVVAAAVVEPVEKPADNVSPAPTPGHVAKPDPELERVQLKRALNDMAKDDLIALAKRHNVYQKYMDKPRIVEKLVSVGARPVFNR
jgi:hypothetical protein